MSREADIAYARMSRLEQRMSGGVMNEVRIEPMIAAVMGDEMIMLERRAEAAESSLVAVLAALRELHASVADYRGGMAPQRRANALAESARILTEHEEPKS